MDFVPVEVRGQFGESGSLLSALWVPGLKLRWSESAAGTFTHPTISPTLIHPLNRKKGDCHEARLR